MTARRRKTGRADTAHSQDAGHRSGAAAKNRARDAPSTTSTVSPEKAFLSIALIFGVMFVFVTPPFQVPDEPQHFYRAFQVSELGFLSPMEVNDHQGALLPKSLAALVDSSDVASTRFRPENKVNPAKFLATLHAPLNPRDREILPVSSYPPVGYLPQAVGIGIGRLFGASPLVLFYLGRLSALGAWIAVIVLAVRTTPLLKWVYVLLALMPMTLYLAASHSVDNVATCVSFLLSAQLLSWAYDPTRERISLAESAGLPVMALVLALSKAIYLPLIFLFFLVPQKKFETRTRYFLTFGAVVIVCLVAYYGWNLYSRWAMTSGPSLELSRHGVDASHLPDVSAERQLAFIRANPWTFAGVLAATLSTPKILLAYLVTFVGVLGWLDVRLPFRVEYVYFTAVIAAALLGGSRELVSWAAKGLAVGVFALTWLISLVYLYLGYSSVGMIVVGGFQGRYLIPIAPVFFLVFYNRYARWRITNIVAGALIVVVVFTDSAAAYSLVKRFYVANVAGVPSFAIEHASLSTAGDAVIVKGWAIDRTTEDIAAGVDVEIDGQHYRARYGLDRLDVAQRLGKPSYRYSGFEAHIPIAQLGKGRHMLALRILTKNHTPYVVPEKKITLEYK